MAGSSEQPYKVTVTKPSVFDRPGVRLAPHVTERAVSSLEKARGLVSTDLMGGTLSRADSAIALLAVGEIPADGGTVELPDGGCVEVKPTTLAELKRGLPGPFNAGPGLAGEIIEAFNRVQDQSQTLTDPETGEVLLTDVRPVTEAEVDRLPEPVRSEVRRVQDQGGQR